MLFEIRTDLLYLFFLASNKYDYSFLVIDPQTDGSLHKLLLLVSSAARFNA